MQLRTTVLALALALLPFVSAAPPAVAQEEAPEPGEPIKFSDRADTVAIDLPRNWKAEKHNESAGQFGFWLGPGGAGKQAGCVIQTVNGTQRALMARHTQMGTLQMVDGETSAGDGWAQGVGIDEEAERVYWDRYIEKDGRVYMARFITYYKYQDDVDALAKTCLATFRVPGGGLDTDPPKGWLTAKSKPFVVWHADEEKKDKVKGATALGGTLADVRKIAESALDGDPFDESTPVLRVFFNGTHYETFCKSSMGEAPDNAALDSTTGSVAVKWMSRRSQGFDNSLQQMVAAQYVTQFFGGSVPLWLRGGLMVYVNNAFEDGGKPKKPAKDRLSRTRGVVARTSRTLDQWFTLRSNEVPDMDAGFQELWAYHWFLRHAKQGKKYRKTYELCIATLRETGDPAAAHAVWDGTDFGKMLEDLKAWGKSLK